MPAPTQAIISAMKTQFSVAFKLREMNNTYQLNEVIVLLLYSGKIVFADSDCYDPVKI